MFTGGCSFSGAVVRSTPLHTASNGLCRPFRTVLSRHDMSKVLCIARQRHPAYGPSPSSQHDGFCPAPLLHEKRLPRHGVAIEWGQTHVALRRRHHTDAVPGLLLRVHPSGVLRCTGCLLGGEIWLATPTPPPQVTYLDCGAAHGCIFPRNEQILPSHVVVSTSDICNLMDIICGTSS